MALTECILQILKILSKNNIFKETDNLFKGKILLWFWRVLKADIFFFRLCVQCWILATTAQVIETKKKKLYLLLNQDHPPDLFHLLGCPLIPWLVAVTSLGEDSNGQDVHTLFKIGNKSALKELKRFPQRKSLHFPPKIRWMGLCLPKFVSFWGISCSPLKKQTKESAHHHTRYYLDSSVHIRFFTLANWV